MRNTLSVPMKFERPWQLRCRLMMYGGQVLPGCFFLYRDPDMPAWGMNLNVIV